MTRTSLRVAALAATLTASLAIVGCDQDSHEHHHMTHTEKKMGEASLYDRLGGEPAIKAVCDDFVQRAATDPKVDFFRKNVPGYTPWTPTDQELATFKLHLYQFVEMAAGGPQKYEGKDMKTTHKGMKITQGQFDALAGDLKASLDKFHVPAKEQGELLKAVAGTAPDIVEVP